jgi:hypothetical protein
VPFRQLISFAIAALMGLACVAGPTPAAAKPSEPNAAQATIDSFVAYLKSETNEAMSMAARMARDNKDSLAAAKSYLDRQLSAWRDLLSDLKATAGTLGEDAATTWEAWRQAATASWAAIERQALDALDWIETWMRNQSLSDRNPETPV